MLKEALMEAATETFARFVGGDLEIQNPGEEYVFRGPTQEIVIEDGELRVRFEWIAKNDGSPSKPASTWTKQEDMPPYAVDLSICVQGPVDGGRMIVTVPVTGEILAFFAPGGSRLDPARVVGL